VFKENERKQYSAKCNLDMKDRKERKECQRVHEEGSVNLCKSTSKVINLLQRVWYIHL
jgi:hypothetical protein